MRGGGTNFWEKTSINVVVNVIRTLITALVGILLVPYYIDELGMAVYGVIPLATAMTSYIMIISDALVSACSRYTVIAIQQGDVGKTSVAFNTALVGIGRNLLLLIPVVILFSILSPYIFTIDEGAVLDVQLMFLFVLLSAVIVTFSSAFNSIFSAFNKLYVLYAIRIFYTLVQVGIIVMMFNFSDPSLVDVGVAYVASSLCLLLFTAVYSLRLVPDVKLNRADYDPSLFREIGSLGIWTIVLKVGSLLFIQMSLVITNIYLGSEVEGGFAIVASLLSMVNTACYSMVAAVAPLIFKHFANNESRELVNFLCTTLKFISLGFAFPIAFIFMFSDQILTAWVGSEYQYLSDLVVIAFFAELAFCAATVLEDVPIAFLRVREIGIMTVLFGIINIVLAMLFVNFTDLGEKGIMFAWTISTIGVNLYLYHFNARIIGVGTMKLLLPVLEGYVCSATLVGVFYLLSPIISVDGNWPSVLFSFFIMAAVYLVIMMSVLMSHDEKRLISSAIPSSVHRFIPKFMLR